MSNQSQNISPSELYAIHLENEEPSFYCMIPHLISYLTYDFIDKDGKKEVRKLSLVARELYRVIKQTAGDRGKCWRDTDGLAELCGMSVGSVVNAKKELQQNFHQLNNTPLITVVESKKANFKNDKCVNKSPSHIITVKNIWGFNNAYMSTLKYQKVEAGSPHESAQGEAGSPHEPNNNPNNKNPLSKEQQPTACADSVVGCFLNKEDSVLVDKKARACNWFLQIGCDLKTATYFVETYSSDDIYQASMYTEQQLKKKKAKNQTIPNIIGYLRNTLKNRYWEKK